MFRNDIPSELAREHYALLHKGNPALVDALTRFTMQHTYPICRSLDDILAFESNSPSMQGELIFIKSLM